MDYSLALKEWQTMEDKYKDIDRLSAGAYLHKQGVPVELVTRIEEVWDVTKSIGGKFVYVGKVIICNLLEFIKDHPNTVAGTLIGAFFGALPGLIPGIGPIIMPVTVVLGMLYGGTKGAMKDTGEDDAMDALIEVAKDFARMLAEIWNTLFNGD